MYLPSHSQLDEIHLLHWEVENDTLAVTVSGLIWHGYTPEDEYSLPVRGTLTLPLFDDPPRSVLEVQALIKYEEFCISLR